MTYSISEQLFVFESPIDAMSHASSLVLVTGDKDVWLKQNRLSLAGTSNLALIGYLSRHPHVRMLTLCLDNDESGRNAAKSIASDSSRTGYCVTIETPVGKDFNDDLQQLRIKMGAEKRPQQRHDLML